MIVVFLLGAVPLVLMNTIVNKTARKNTLKNTTALTQGILDQSQKYFNGILNELNNFSNDFINNKELMLMLGQEHISINSIKLLKQLKASTSIINEMVVIDLDEAHPSILFNRASKKEKKIDSELVKEFLHSQPALLLKENSSRNLWLGTAPKGITKLEKSIWNYRILQTQDSSFILAVSIDSGLLADLVSSIEKSTKSEVRLITSDNSIYPIDNRFFNYNFAPKTLSRTNKGRFINFNDIRIINGETEKLLIQLYSDPKYFYNLIVLTPEKNLLQGFKAISRTTSLALIILSLFSIIFGLISVIFLQKRISQLITGVKSISLGTFNISLPNKKISIKENISLTKAIIDVAEEVKSNRKQLKGINEDLERRVIHRTKELELTRESLIHSENMATLGRNAAKIAHEINNPLYISITASSHLSFMIQKLKDNFENNKLTKTYLTDFSSSAQEIVGMIEKNLEIASKLSSSFKNFASELSSEKKREINIKYYIDEIIKGYSYKLKSTPYKIAFICKENLKIKTYPAIVYQVITNLINNCLLHGFDNMDNGIIDLIVSNSNEHLEIIVQDNGVGISKENQLKLYKPFFSTKHGEGGTGLGLNIIKDLIENRLKGTIECISAIDDGTKFIIKIPKGD